MNSRQAISKRSAIDREFSTALHQKTETQHLAERIAT